jgi:hypothetical protein
MVVRGTMGYTTRERGRPPMSVEVLLSVCSVLVPAVVLWLRRIHRLETERDRQRAVRRHTDILTLRAGETFVGVLEGDEGQCLFLTHRATERPHDA